MTNHRCVCIAREYRPESPEARREIVDPEAAVGELGPLLEGLDREGCAAAYLDTKNRVIGSELVSLGSLDHTFIVPRDVLRGALLHNAAAVVIAHNHPSGDATPSSDDERVTRRLHQACQLVGVELLDHLVIGYARWESLARRGGYELTAVGVRVHDPQLRLTLAKVWAFTLQ